MTKRNEENIMNRKYLSARVPTELVKDIKIFCVKNDMSLKDFLVRASKEKEK